MQYWLWSDRKQGAYYGHPILTLGDWVRGLIPTWQEQNSFQPGAEGPTTPRQRPGGG